MDIEYYSRQYNFLGMPIVCVSQGPDIPYTFVARKGPFVATLQRPREGDVWEGRLLFGGDIGISGLENPGTPTLIGISKPDIRVGIVLARLADVAHKTAKAVASAVRKPPRPKKKSYGSPRK